ncbi:meiotic recombination protein SPO11-like isoform X6, partial [Dinothrombium tinctorium]
MSQFLSFEDHLADDFWLNLYSLKQKLNDECIHCIQHLRFAESNESRQFLIVIIKQLIEKLEYIPCSQHPTSEPFEEFSIVDRRSWQNVGFNESEGIFLVKEPTKFIRIRSKRQAQMLTLLTKIYELLIENKFSTKRAIFYDEKDIFQKQSMVTELIDDICCILKVNRFKVHIHSSSKGLIFGDVTIVLNDNEEISCNNMANGTNIPTKINEITKLTSSAKFVLLVEKDSCFQRLLNSNFCKFLPAIIITGKGFPDSNTREMVRLLWEFLRVPILALVDADPFGIEIMFTYRYGSL